MHNNVSVIIPTFNRERTISYCINSVLEQTLKVNEIIIIDDGSTDNTEIIVENLIRNNPTIKYYKQSNNGAQTARNLGISKANSKWIAFLDSDDKWEENKLELQMRELEKVNFDVYTVVHGDCYCFDTINNKKWVWNLPETQGNCYELLLERPSPMFQGMLVSKQSLIEITLLDELAVSFQEWDTSIRLSKICNFIHIKNPLFTYILHEEETISKDNIKYIKGYIYILNKFKDDFYKYHDEIKWKKKVEDLKEKALKENIYKKVEYLFNV